jgi:hypothetical protein
MALHDEPTGRVRLSIQADTPEDVRQEILAYLEREVAYHRHIAERTGSARLRASSLACETAMQTAYETWRNVVIEPKNR